MANPGQAEQFSGTRCIVTGGLGFMGSGLSRTLAQAGAEVTVIDSLEPRHGGSLDNVAGVDVEIITEDIASRGAVADSIREADYIFNLAGQVSHIDSMTDPLGDLEINGTSQLAFLELIRESGRRPTVIFASTRQVYGQPQYLPIDEGHPVKPVDVNGITKFAAEQFHRLYNDVYGVPTVVLRFSNVYGPRQRLFGAHQGFLPIFVRRALEGDPIELYGDGSQKRDCLYVTDAVDALLAAALTREAVGEIINVGHPHDHSLREIAEMIIAVSGRGSIEIVPWPPGSKRIAIGSCRVDSTKAGEMLGWRPDVELDLGLEEMVAFCRGVLV